MMLRRRAPSAIPSVSSTCTPPSSGPRCNIALFIAATAAPGALAVLPQMPHMARYETKMTMWSNPPSNQPRTARPSLRFAAPAPRYSRALVMQRTNEPEGVDPREFLRPIWTHKWLILIVVIASTALAYAYSERQPDQFTASTRLYVQALQLDPFAVQTPTQDDRSTQNQATLLETRSVAVAAAKRLGFTGDPGELLGSIEVTPEKGSDFVTITATRGNPKDAANFANAFARVFVRVRATAQRRRVRAARAAAERELAQLPELQPAPAARAALERTIRRYELMEALPSGSTERVDRALPSSVRSAPKPQRNAAFAFALSLVFGILAAYGLERFDRRLKRLGQVSPAYHARLLAALPHASRRALKRRLALAEPFR